MSQMIDIKNAKQIMGRYFIGPDELASISDMGLQMPDVIPEIQYNESVLKEKKNDYILILGLSSFDDGNDVTIRNLIERFGKDPKKNDPCFYNQDWYEKESFIDYKMDEGWYLIRKNVFEDSRAKQPEDLLVNYEFPKAITCAYAFFVSWLALDEKLWYHDFVWCNDVDHNGDRIYVGKYHDVDGVNKNGFSIHRHLALRTCYGAIDET